MIQRSSYGNICQINASYILNFHTIMCQLYLNKTEKKKKNPQLRDKWLIFMERDERMEGMMISMSSYPKLSEPRFLPRQSQSILAFSRRIIKREITIKIRKSNFLFVMLSEKCIICLFIVYGYMQSPLYFIYYITVIHC